MLNRRMQALFAQLYQDQAGGGDDGKGGASGGADAGGAAGAGGAADAGAGAAGATAGSDQGGDKGGAGSGAGGDDKSLFAELGQGAAGAAAAAGDKKVDDTTLTPEARALQAAEKDTRRPQHVPAKYWDAEKGEVRTDAAIKSATALEQRMRDVGLPPKSADEYKFEVPKQLKEAGIELDETTTKAFRSKALELGLTQKQYEAVMSEYFGTMTTMANGATAYGREKLRGQLLTHYKTPEAVQENVNLAFAVVNAYGDEAEIAEAMGASGNTPPWVYRVLAKVGKELGEDKGVKPDEMLGGDSVEHLRRGAPGREDSPYWNKDDPRHAETVRKVTAYHQAQELANKRRRGA